MGIWDKHQNLYSTIEKRAKLALSPFGNETGRHAIRDPFLDIRQKIDTRSPLIIDGGTNIGHVTFSFLRLYKNKCTVHCFEPIPKLADSLKEKFIRNNKVIVHNNALGDENKTISFNITCGDYASSALKPNQANLDQVGRVAEIDQIIEIEQVRLDSVINEDIDILKLDLQGYELQALEGCGKLLENTKLIYTEVEFNPLYEQQALFGDIDCYLRNKDFSLFNLYDLNTSTEGKLITADALYLNERYF